jgi:hypothetical protein
MEIISINLNHTCSKDGNKRKQNYLTRDIISVMSNVLDVYYPADSGNTKQFIQITKAATGLTLKTGQANNVVQSKINDTILEAQIGQYLLIPSLLSAYQEADALGTYTYETALCSWDGS